VEKTTRTAGRRRALAKDIHALEDLGLCSERNFTRRLIEWRFLFGLGIALSRTDASETMKSAFEWRSEPGAET
jgi:hypothetical protein